MVNNLFSQTAITAFDPALAAQSVGLITLAAWSANDSFHVAARLWAIRERSGLW